MVEEPGAVAGCGPAEVADLMRGDELGRGPGAASGRVDVDEAPSGSPVGLPPAVGGDASPGAGGVTDRVGEGLDGVDASEAGADR